MVHFSCVKKIQNITGVRLVGLVKREMGVIPIRTRRCNGGVCFQDVTGNAGKTKTDVDS